MTKLKDFNLALGVINNILICDVSGKIVFVGDEIQAVLFSHNLPLKPYLMDNFNQSTVREELSVKIDEVRREKHTCQYYFDELDETVFIFPANYNESDNIILSTKEQLLLANNLQNDLKERVKELKCLYSISHELELSDDLPKALHACVEHLIAAFQYPDFANANIRLGERDYGETECSEPEESIKTLREDIVVSGRKRGHVEVCYLQDADFLPEERKMIREVALMVAKSVEKVEYRETLEENRKLLLKKNEELTRLTDSLTAGNNKLNALFSAITDTLVVVDPGFTVDISNKADIKGGDKCYQKLFDSSEICDGCPTHKVFKTGEPASVEKQMGDQYYLLQAYPIQGKDDGVDRVIEVCRNITLEKHMEQQLIQSYKLASLGKLTAGVAHEINNPNTFIRGNINIINEAFADILPILDDAYDADPSLKIARLNYELFKENIPILIEDMVGGANRIKKIVDGLRNFARKDEDQLTDDVDLNFIVQNNLRITQKEVRKHARIEEKLSENIPTTKGSVSKLEQVLMNLLVNASHAIEHDQGLIILETGHTPEKNEVWIRISDNGKGIDDKTRRHIFDPFFTTKRNRGGTGLGLSISYGIIQEHNGRIEVDSKVGEGTTFTITFPVVRDN